MLGVAYKKNVEDTRESPAFTLIEQMEARGAKIDFFDPFVPVVPHLREHPQMSGRRSIRWNAKALARYDCALIVTDHDGVDYAGLLRATPLVVDTRNATRGLKGAAKVVLG